MSPSGCPTLTDSTVELCSVLLIIAAFALAGLALMNAGFTRTRSVSQFLTASLTGLSICLVAYLSVGFPLQSAPCLQSRSLFIGGKAFNWIGAGPFFLHGIDSGASGVILLVLFALLSAFTCILIPLSAAAERWRLGPSLASAALLSGVLFPIYAHWSWPGGWLNQLGAMYGLRSGFIDVGGAGFIHTVGGLTALAVVWILGPRRGKYNASGLPAATPGHNSPYILIGCLLALIGWFGLNTAGAILLSNAAIRVLPNILLNTVSGGAGGLIAAAFTTRVRFGKPDASLCANGWVAGLVAISAGCGVIRSPEAVLIGLIAGTLVPISIEALEVRLKIDDPGGAISVHAVGGLWGLLAVGLFSNPEQLAAQLSGVATLLGFIFPAAYGFNLLLNRFLPYRVTREGERQGMDLSDLGAGAYPEFMLHRDDLSIR